MPFFVGWHHIGIPPVIWHDTCSIRTIEDVSQDWGNGRGKLLQDSGRYLVWASCLGWVQALQELKHTWDSEVYVRDIWELLGGFVVIREGGFVGEYRLKL